MNHKSCSSQECVPRAPEIPRVFKALSQDLGGERDKDQGYVPPGITH